jgi:hypothetical protein
MALYLYLPDYKAALLPTGEVTVLLVQTKLLLIILVQNSTIFTSCHFTLLVTRMLGW